MQSNRLQVLVVDDEEVVRSGLSGSECFPQAGYRVVGTAADGREALALTSQLKPDLIVTDINMPVMDGLSYLHALRQTGDDTAVLILSCYDDFQFAQRAIQLEVVSYLLKPFTDEELTEALLRAKKMLVEKKNKRHALETEQFLLQGKDSVLRDLLRQVIVRGGREEMIHNIHHFGLMEAYPFYGLVYFREITLSAQDTLDTLLTGCADTCHLLEAGEGACLVLVCSRNVSLARFAERVRELCAEWRQALALAPDKAVAGGVFTTLEQAHECFLQMLAKAGAAEAAGGQPEPEQTDGREEIKRAIDFIEAHLCDEALCLNMVAESIFISPFYFSRLFAKETGMSFVRYVNARRVEKACILLRKGKLRIYEISKATGFQNETYFYQVFKTIKGVTPKKYQQQHRSQ